MKTGRLDLCHEAFGKARAGEAGRADFAFEPVNQNPSPTHIHHQLHL
jgi:hypothetical protein